MTDLKKLAEDASQGPWRSLDARDDWEFAFDGIYRVSAPDNPMPADVIEQFDNRPIVAECAESKNARYIAAANPKKILELLQEVETLRAQAAQSRQEALEEAAKVCETLELTLKPYKYPSLEDRHLIAVTEAGCRNAFAKAIRALQQHTGEDGETKP